FEEHIQQAEIEDVCHRMLELREKCVSKKTGEAYIISSKGGRQNSPEDAAVKYIHGFIVEFSSEEDRKYYLEEDPAHLAFVKSLEGVVKEAGIFDFTPGVF
ncbi:MAG: hypothetical protein Q9218_007547, partial [Villophora microphyllina]